MQIANEDVVVVLSHEGRGALRELGIDVLSSPVLFHALESDERGVWVLDQREDGDHRILIRWEHILALDTAKGEIRTEGPVN